MNRIERQQHASKPKSTMRTCIVFTKVFKMEEEKERQIAFLHDVLLIRDDHWPWKQTGFIKRLVQVQGKYGSDHCGKDA